MAASLAKIVGEVLKHLQELINEPTTSINRNALQQISALESNQLAPEQRGILLGLSCKALSLTSQDPSPLVELIKTITQADGCTFELVKSILPSEILQAGLEAQHEDLNLVILDLLLKATEESANVYWLALQRGIVEALVTKWLSSEYTGVANLAQEVLVSALKLGVDDGTKIYDVKADPMTCENMMYRRLFRDQDTYRLFFHHCGVSQQHSDQGISRNQRSLAQGRLLSFLQQVRNSAVRTSHHPDIEKEYGAADDLGLVGFAFNNMVNVDDDDDTLSAIVFIDACREYISGAPLDATGEDSWERQCLEQSGVIQKCMKYYLASDRTTPHGSLLTPKSAEFIHEYCSSYRHLIRRDRKLVMDLKDRAESGFRTIEHQQWFSNAFSDDDLAVLSGLPQELFASRAGSSIINDIPLVNTHVTVLDLFVPLFVTSHIRDPESIDRQAARVNYCYYVRKNGSFWKAIVVAASNLTSPEVAFAANNLLDQLIGTSWEALPSSDSASGLPTEQKFTQDFGMAPPTTGVEAILTDHNYREVLNYLLCTGEAIMPRSTVYDERSTAWHIIDYKHEILKHFQERMLMIEGEDRHLLGGRSTLAGGESILAMQEAVDKRLLESPMGPATSRSVGQEVATMGS